MALENSAAVARPIHFSLAVLLAIGLAGCCCAPAPKARPPYAGPTLTMRELGNRVNQNNDRIPSIFSHMFFAAEVYDEKGHRHAVTGDGLLVYRRPHDFLLRANGPLGTVFEVGSTEDEYWLKVVPEVETMWYGHYANVPSDTHRLPIRPDLVLEVLAVQPIDTNFLQLPVPTLRVSTEEYFYKLDWNMRLRDRWAAQKEVWYDIVTLEPRRVLIYDPNGRVVLRAELSKSVEIAPSPNEPPGPRPKMASHFELVFPDTKASMTFDLTDAAIQNAKGIPKAGSIRMPSLEEPGVANPPINLDAHTNEGQQGPR